MTATMKQSANYRRYTVSGYNVELIKRPGNPTYWQFRVWASDRLVESGWLGSRDEAATVAGLAIADHRDQQG